MPSIGKRFALFLVGPAWSPAVWEEAGGISATLSPGDCCSDNPLRNKDMEENLLDRKWRVGQRVQLRRGTGTWPRAQGYAWGCCSSQASCSI